MQYHLTHAKLTENLLPSSTSILPTSVYFVDVARINSAPSLIILYAPSTSSLRSLQWLKFESAGDPSVFLDSESLFVVPNYAKAVDNLFRDSKFSLL